MSGKKKLKLLAIDELEQLAQIIISKFISKGVIPYEEKEDIKQTLLEKYLVKEQKIAESFNGKAKPKTYCSAVLYKMTCEVIRSELKNWKNINKDASEMLVNNSDNSLNPEQKAVLQNEVDLLDKVLTTMGAERAKTELFLKYYFRLPIEKYDLERYSSKEVLELLQNNAHLKDKEIYNNLTKVVEYCENKLVKPDAIRMYINKQLGSIIARLNGKMSRANYSKETLGFLFEIFARRDMETSSYNSLSIIILFLLAVNLI